MYVDRHYRRGLKDDLEQFEIKVDTSDLMISVRAGSVDQAASREMEDFLYHLRGQLADYITRDPVFQSTLQPHLVLPDAPPIAREMAYWANRCDVGPMAAVAGGFAQTVGEWICRRYSPEVIVENGGDIYLASDQPRVVGVFAGSSPFSGRIGIRLDPRQLPAGICTSSGTVGPSLSLGRADAALIIADSAYLADAAATRAGNRVQSADDFQQAIDAVREIPGIRGILLIVGDKMAAWGQLEIVPLEQARG